MSREIKFRVWSDGYKKYLKDLEYPNGHSYLWIFAQDGTPYHIETDFEDGIAAIPLKEKIGEVVLEQFTGLHDKNGNEIYEGDILAHWHYKNYSKGEMVWDEDNAAWAKFHPLDQFEVIGNIHENPELLLTN